MPFLAPLIGALAGPLIGQVGNLISGAIGNKAAPSPPENPFNEAALKRVIDQVANGVKAKLASESGT